jgi:hypothetical protein
MTTASPEPVIRTSILTQPFLTTIEFGDAMAESLIGQVMDVSLFAVGWISGME